MISPAMVDFLMQAGLTTRTMTWKAKKQQVRFVTWTRKAIFQYKEIAERMEKSRVDLILAGRELLKEIWTVLKLVPFAFDCETTRHNPSKMMFLRYYLFTSFFSDNVFA